MILRWSASSDRFQLRQDALGTLQPVFSCLLTVVEVAGEPSPFPLQTAHRLGMRRGFQLVEPCITRVLGNRQRGRELRRRYISRRE